jgi:subtilase family serine protease
VAKFLSSSGLTVVPSGSPFLVRTTGSSAKVQSTFHTTLNNFKDPQGTQYFANSTPVYLPGSIAGASLGVIGLTNTVRDAQHVFPLQQHDAHVRRRGLGDQLRDDLSHRPAVV